MTDKESDSEQPEPLAGDKLLETQKRVIDLEEDLALNPEHLEDSNMKAGNSRHQWVKISFDSDYGAGNPLTVYHQYGQRPSLVLPSAWESYSTAVLSYNRNASDDTKIIVRKNTNGANTVWAMLI